MISVRTHSTKAGLYRAYPYRCHHSLTNAGTRMPPSVTSFLPPRKKPFCPDSGQIGSMSLGPLARGCLGNWQDVSRIEDC